MNMNHLDTICGIATAFSNCGIGIIRVSGEDAIEKVDHIFSGKSKLVDVPSHTVHYGNIISEGKILDEVMVLIFRSPKSYTTENTVEIDCHGGVVVLKQVLDAVMKQGIRPAEPGEFTKRAFLNGRIDLSQAESVMDVIDAKSKFALQNSMNQLQGQLSDMIESLRKKIIYEIAFIESALDDPEHISLDGYYENLFPKIQTIVKEIKKSIDSSENGSMLKEGIYTSIIGKPNAGKSSLLNILAKKDRAIVTDIAGTTRDTLEEQIMLNGISLNVMDTAGIRETEDSVEKIGVKKALESIKNANLILYVVDSSVPLNDNDFEIIKNIKNKNVIILLNKADLCPVVTEKMMKEYCNGEILSFSAKTGDGLEDLENMITKMFFEGDIQENDQVILTNARHISALKNAYESLMQVMESIKNQMPEDFLSIDLMDAYESLGTIIGESVEEDLVNEIFSKFCTGK